MTLALLTFVLTMTLVLGSYWAFVARPEAQAAGRLRQRLQIGGERPAGPPSIVKAAPAARIAGGLFGRIRRWHQQYAVTAAARLIESAGARTDPHWLIAGTLATWIVVTVVLRLVQASWLVSLVAGSLTPFVPYAYIRHAARRRLNAFELQFPDALMLMSRALRAGHALTSTLAMVAEEVADPLKSEFRAIYEQHNYGLPMPQVLRTFAQRIPLVDARFFVTAVLTQRETGGNLAEVLDNLARVMRDRSRVRRQVRALTAQGRMSGWILGALPILVAVGMYVMNPAQMLEFMRDPIGFHLLIAAAVLEVIGVAWIRQILDVGY